jgi:hypothetical protein
MNAPSELTLESACRTVTHLIAERDARIRADVEWLRTQMPEVASAGSSLEDDVATKIRERNMVLYCIGVIDQAHFRYGDIEKVLKQEFSDKNESGVLNVARAMSELAGGEVGILTSTPARDAYMLKDPIFRTAIRSMLLRKDDMQALEQSREITKAINPDGKLFSVRWV